MVAPMAFHAMVNAWALTATFVTAAAFANSPMIGLETEGRDEGCLVVQVTPGSPAEEAGIHAGDIVTELDVYSVREHPDIFSVLAIHKAGDTIPVKYLRNGKQFAVDVTLKKRPK